MKQNALVSKQLLLTYLKHANELERIRLKFINQCAPLIKGIKPSVYLLISTNEWILWKSIISDYHFMYDLFYKGATQTAVLIYEKEAMNALIMDTNRQEYLCGLGYDLTCMQEVMKLLSVKLKAYYQGDDDFPHELGILLGYPIGDVVGYQKTQGCNYTYSGYWKVYTNTEETILLFQQFDKARKEMLLKLIK